MNNGQDKEHETDALKWDTSHLASADIADLIS